MPPAARQTTVTIPEERPVEMTRHTLYNFLYIASKVTVAVSLAVLAFEISRITFVDDEGHYIMNIGTHDVH
jgi:hypothetical protein